MGYIIDTDVCIDFLKNKDYAVNLFSEILNENCYISILTQYELLKGAFTPQQQKIIQDFVKLIEIINLDGNIIKTGAEFYRKYRKKGITLSNIDCLIMATAKEKNLKMITRNVKHYPALELLSEFSKNLL
ncbi:type II toxin-antitoxin system VapC family toxin [Persephonella sp. KM09-Lau-8]|uniref:type II toxin-antitoxin system VapC family toxin n=1 Tax=Persephonella sp. KM09-Lau-8 TaxID=1158345 RepID=UPI000497BE75|nr:type II toxin-antitoxin system VapC family toxin [Persephonella sp. KM09-Lau-8]